MLVDHLNIQPDAVFGHSFGGKVALQYLLDCERLTRKIPKQVWVLDSLPGTRATDYSKRVLTASIENILPKLKEIPIPIYSKTQLIKDLQGKGIRLEEAQWLTTNLRLINANPETYLWKMDVQVIEKLFQSFLDSDFWPALENPPRGTEIHFVRAEKSKMWSNEIVKKLENLSNKGVHLHYLEKADHWVHIDNPNGLLEIILRYR
jgi:pimeloyl-ACP methyl ester carboxylesterase